MGQNVCGCSMQYITKGADDLPDRIPEHSSHKNSITSFTSHKIVTTITMRSVDGPLYQHHHQRHHRSKSKKHHKHKHKHKNKKRRLLENNNYIHDSIALEPIEPITRPYVLYREGVSETNDGQILELNTITTAMMIEMDIGGKSDILSTFQLNHIFSRCPSRYHCMKWKKLYSLLQDGCSMQTFWQNCAQIEDGSILIIQDQSNNIFGAFVDSKWKAEYHHYKGSNSCFVYRFEFEHDEYSIFEYHSTGKKPYYVQSDYKGITIGAGECPAIYIDNNLLMGRTTKSDTFQSDPLTPNSIFQIKNVEVWFPSFDIE